MRFLYSLFLYLLSPVIFLWLALRGLRDRRYLAHWDQRLGFAVDDRARGGIVVHAASVGEVNAAAALIEALLAEWPDWPLTLTTFTTTGAQRGRRLFGERVIHRQAVMDFPRAVNRFLRAIRPRLLIIMETEIWPNLFAAAHAGGIPILLANGRLSERSVNGYRRFRTLIGRALRRLSLILAQEQVDAARFAACGAAPDSIRVVGNLKFELTVPDGLVDEAIARRLSWGPSRFVLVAGSTHQADEPVILQSFKNLLLRNPDALLVMVPRHPERFERCAEQIRQSGLTLHRHSAQQGPPSGTQCVLVDVMGELLTYYACADVAFVGGSLAAVGGHNVLEPAALGKAVLVGPHTENFADVTDQLVACGGALRVNDEQDFTTALTRLADHAGLCSRMGGAGLTMLETGRGALAHSLVAIRALLESAAG